MSDGRGKKFIAINYGSPGPVVFSQLIEYTLQMQTYDIFFDYYFLLPGKQFFTRNQKYAQKIVRLRETARGTVKVFPAPFIRRKAILDLYGALIKRQSCHHKSACSRGVIVHPRGLPSALIANSMRKRGENTSYLYDMRGDSLAEFAYQNRRLKTGLESRLPEYKALEGEALAGAGHVVCVSHVLKELAIERYSLDSSKITVIPCCADEKLFKPDLAKRQRVRTELQIDGTFNLIYCGGLNMWHCAEEMFRLLGGVLRAVQDAYFVILTPHQSEAGKLAEQFLPEARYLINEVPREEVPRYMLASDMGVILRHNTAVNRASSPTKIAEYLISGLPVLLTENIGDYSQLIADHQLGYLIGNDPIDVEKTIRPVVEYIKQERWPDREAISDFGVENFSKARFVPRLKAIYDSL